MNVGDFLLLITKYKKINTTVHGNVSLLYPYPPSSPLIAIIHLNQWDICKAFLGVILPNGCPLVFLDRVCIFIYFFQDGNGAGRQQFQQSWGGDRRWGGQGWRGEEEEEEDEELVEDGGSSSTSSRHKFVKNKCISDSEDDDWIH